MGGVLAAIVFKNGNERIQLQSQNEGKSLWDIPVVDITGNELTLREIVQGKRAVLFVNIATK